MARKCIHQRVNGANFPAVSLRLCTRNWAARTGGRREYDVLFWGAKRYRVPFCGPCRIRPRALRLRSMPTAQTLASLSATNKSAICSGFFSNGYSVFEAFCFALFAVGALIDPAHFPLATEKDERAVHWDKMQQAYRKAFPG